MSIKDLKSAIENHKGTFVCFPRGDRYYPKKVEFRFEHSIEQPQRQLKIPDIGDLRTFYENFGSLKLYHHSNTDDSAYYLARFDQWESLKYEMNEWVQDLDEDEREELLPAWYVNALVIGEVPHSGNYILVATDGEEVGYVYEFEHDGFEFLELGKNLEDFLNKVLYPSEDMLTDMATYMTFSDQNMVVQWWIEKMHTDDGMIVKTNV